MQRGRTRDRQRQTTEPRRRRSCESRHFQTNGNLSLGSVRACAHIALMQVFGIYIYIMEILKAIHKRSVPVSAPAFTSHQTTKENVDLELNRRNHRRMNNKKTSSLYTESALVQITFCCLDQSRVATINASKIRLKITYSDQSPLKYTRHNRFGGGEKVFFPFFFGFCFFFLLLCINLRNRCQYRDTQFTHIQFQHPWHAHAQHDCCIFFSFYVMNK